MKPTSGEYVPALGDIEMSRRRFLHGMGSFTTEIAIAANVVLGAAAVDSGYNIAGAAELIAEAPSIEAVPPVQFGNIKEAFRYDAALITVVGESEGVGWTDDETHVLHPP